MRPSVAAKSALGGGPRPRFGPEQNTVRIVTFFEAESMHFYVPLVGNSILVEAKRGEAVVGFASEPPEGSFQALWRPGTL